MEGSTKPNGGMQSVPIYLEVVLQSVPVYLEVVLHTVGVGGVEVLHQDGQLQPAGPPLA